MHRGRPVATAGLEHHRREHRGEFGRRQTLPEAPAQTFGDQQVTLAVDACQQPAGVGDRRGCVPGGVLRGGVTGADVPALGEQTDDPVERARQRVGGRGDLVADLAVIAFGPQIALGDAHPGLAVGHPVRGVAAHLLAQREQFGIGVVCVTAVAAAPAPAPPGGDHQTLGSRAQRRGQVAAHPGLTVLDALGQCHRSDRRHRAGVVGRGNPSGPTLLGEHQRTGVVAVPGRLKHHRQSTPATVGERDDVTAAQRCQRLARGGAALQPRTAGRDTFPFGDGGPQPRVFQDRRLLGLCAAVPAELGGDVVEQLLAALRTAHHPDHRAVHLVLGERPLKQCVRLLRSHLADEVDGHVVRRREGTAQREGPGGGQPGDLGGLGGGVGGMPDHHRVALHVDPPAPGTTGQLGELPRRQRHVLLAVELDQLLQHHRAGRHVDAQRQRLGGEHGLDQAGGEQFLDGVPEGGQHPGVVGGQAPQQALAPFVVVEHSQVGVGEIRAAAVDHLGDALTLGLIGEPQWAAQALRDGTVAAGAGEDEGDRG